MNPDEIINQTRYWLKTVIIDCNFCPFARRELERDSIRFTVSPHTQLQPNLMRVVDECLVLDGDASIETTLLILPQAFFRFDDYLGFIDLAQQLLVKQGYEGTYQLASFHPQYRFADSTEKDAANYTNRSPFPMLHVLREASIEAALSHHDDPATIPARNIEFATAEGLDVMKHRLEVCRQHVTKQS